MACVSRYTPSVRTFFTAKVHRARGSGHGNPSAIMHIGFIACFHGIALERRHFRKITFLFSGSHSYEAVGIAHGPPRSLQCQNKRQQTHKQTKYCNPRCACEPRVNKDRNGVMYLCVPMTTCSEPPPSF